MKNLGVIVGAALVALVVSYVTVRATRVDGPSASGRESVYERVMRTGTIRCGYLTWPPLQEKSLETGKLTGPITEYVEAVGRALELRIEWTEELNLATYLADLNNGRFDVECSGGWPTAHRGKFVEYLRPVFFLPYLVYVRADEARFGKLTDLDSPALTAAVMDGENSSMVRDELFARTRPLALPGTAQGSDLALSVTTKKADFTILDSLSAGLFNASNHQALKPLGEVVQHIAITMSVARGEGALRDMLEVATDQVVLSGGIDRILRKYDPEGVQYVRAAPPFVPARTR